MQSPVLVLPSVESTRSAKTPSSQGCDVNVVVVPSLKWSAAHVTVTTVPWGYFPFTRDLLYSIELDFPTTSTGSQPFGFGVFNLFYMFINFYPSLTVGESLVRGNFYLKLTSLTCYWTYLQKRILLKTKARIFRILIFFMKYLQFCFCHYIVASLQSVYS